MRFPCFLFISQVDRHELIAGKGLWTQKNRIRMMITPQLVIIKLQEAVWRTTSDTKRSGMRKECFVWFASFPSKGAAEEIVLFPFSYTIPWCLDERDIKWGKKDTMASSELKASHDDSSCDSREPRALPDMWAYTFQGTLLLSITGMEVITRFAIERQEIFVA